MIDDVRYRVIQYDRLTGATYRSWVTAMRVGRFAVRMKLETGRLNYGDGTTRACKTFVVDHINTAHVICDFDTFDDALGLADDISRFSKSDPASRDPQRLVHQLGKDVFRWLACCCTGGTYVPFRQWMGQLEGGNAHVGL